MLGMLSELKDMDEWVGETEMPGVLRDNERINSP